MHLQGLMANLERFMAHVPVEQHAALLASTVKVIHLDGQVMGHIFDVCLTTDGQLCIIVSSKE